MKQILVITLTLLSSTILIPSHVTAFSGICGGQPGNDYIQTKGVSQGWLVPYNGENQSFTGIPCKVGEPTDPEINSIVFECCNGQTGVECLKKEELVDSVPKYPTCAERNLVVQQNKNGKLEAFDRSQEDNQSTPTTSQPEISGQNKENSEANRGFLASIWTKFALFLRNLFQR